MSDSDLMSLTVPELKKKLASYGLSRSGRKNDMVTRLEQAWMLQGRDKVEAGMLQGKDKAEAGMLQGKDKAEKATFNEKEGVTMKRVNQSTGEDGSSGESLKKKLKTEAKLGGTDESVLCKAAGLFLDGKFHDNCRGCSIDPVRVVTQPTRTAFLDHMSTIHQKQASSYEGKLFEKCCNCTFWLTHRSIVEKTCEFCQTPFK